MGNDTPIFFIRDPLEFLDFIHSQKKDPFTHAQEPGNIWDFFSLSPEATHQFTWLFGDRGIPASYRHIPRQDRAAEMTLNIGISNRDCASVAAIVNALLADEYGALHEDGTVTGMSSAHSSTIYTSFSRRRTRS